MTSGRFADENPRDGQAPAGVSRRGFLLRTAAGGMVAGTLSPAFAPAIAKAVFHATGRRIRDLPITVEALL
ncbi:twin-arginine translocation signal domain-containing protein [Streptosporangium sp. DT93]|uniref:twin-arginine translocation signal domain-containing protein n=1 Tax=Streptosporangium sp. DT93 TaxID=3393428 RepID=UPI003CFA60D8